MHLLTRLYSTVICCLCLISLTQAQTTPTNNSTGTATVSGVVKIGDNPAANITLTLNSTGGGGGQNRPGNFNAPQAAYSSLRVTTDASGQYSFVNVPAGQYRLVAQADAFVGTRSDVITVAAAQALKAPDMTLTRGGVITGRVSGQDDRPLIAQRISISTVDDQGQAQGFNSGRLSFETDDRGVYRIYGLPAGKYVISAGEGESQGRRNAPPPGPGSRTGTRYGLTYHPDATSLEQAKIIEINTGAEIENVDIRMGEPLKRYLASGRALDADTGQPLVGLSVAAMQTMPGGRGGPGGNNNGATAITDASGNFMFSGLLPGSYSATLNQTPNSGTNYYGRAVSFQIVDSNVSDLLLNLKQGASIAGVVILDGTNDPSARAQLVQTMVMASVRGQNTGNAAGGRGQGGGGGANGRNAIAQVSADGTFRLTGLSAGTVTLSLNSFGGSGSVSMMRLENNGAAWPTSFEIAEAQQITGLRIIAGIGNGIIRGQVMVQGATASNYRMMISAKPLNGGQTQNGMVNQQGQFRFDGLLPGSYELTLQGFAQGVPGAGQGGQGGGRGGGRGGNANNTGNQTNQTSTFPTVKQVVTVTNGVETPAQLTVTISQ